jgi:hypothetical protein
MLYRLEGRHLRREYVGKLLLKGVSPSSRRSSKLPRVRRPGYIALLSVLIVAAIAASTILVLFITSLNSALSSMNISEAKLSRSLADACAERALQSLTDNAPLSPQQIRSFSGGSCTIRTIVNVSGNLWRIQTTGATLNPLSPIVKYLELEALKPSTSSAALVSSWRECLSFPCP